MVIIVVFIIAVFGTILINRLLLVFSKNLGTRGNENIQVRWANTSKPSLGGFAFYIVFIGIIAVIGLMEYDFWIFSKKQLLGVFIAITFGFGIGFADDTYNTNPKLKAFGQLICALILYLFDIQIQLFQDSFLLNFFLTTFWVVGLMNSINMLDNMDGITSGNSILILSTFIIITALCFKTDFNALLILIAIIGSLIGFLYHNWFPSKIYMGDAGSQFLGIFLAIYSIPLLWNNSVFNASIISKFLIPVVVFIVPIIDTITVIFYRLKKGSSPFIGGADHTTHHLVYFGFSERQVFLFFTVINFITLNFITYISFFSKLDIQYQLIIAIYALIVVTIIETMYFKGKFNPQKKKKNNTKDRTSIFEKIFLKN